MAKNTDSPQQRLAKSLLTSGVPSVPDVLEMIEGSAKTMEQRLGGRPRLPDDEKRRAVNFTLSPEAIAALDGWHKSTGKARSELVDSMIRHTAVQPNWPESDTPPTEPLTDAEMQAATSIANHSLSVWAPQRDARSIDDVAEAAKMFFRNAVRIVRANR